MLRTPGTRQGPGHRIGMWHSLRAFSIGEVLPNPLLGGNCAAQAPISGLVRATVLGQQRTFSRILPNCVHPRVKQKGVDQPERGREPIIHFSYRIIRFDPISPTRFRAVSAPEPKPDTQLQLFFGSGFINIKIFPTAAVCFDAH